MINFVRKIIKFQENWLYIILIMNYKYGFSYMFERVQENLEKLWCFERYMVINDYEWRILFFINIVFFLYCFFCCLMRKRGCLNRC